jgi:hypothetical protein
VGYHIIEVAFATCRPVALGLGRDGAAFPGTAPATSSTLLHREPARRKREKPVTIKMLPKDNLDAIFAA